MSRDDRNFKLLKNRGPGFINVAPLVIADASVVGPDGSGFYTITKTGGGSLSDIINSAGIVGPLQLWVNLNVNPINSDYIGLDLSQTGRASGDTEFGMYVDNGGNLFARAGGANVLTDTFVAPTFVLIERNALDEIRLYKGGDGASNKGTAIWQYSNSAAALYLTCMLASLSDTVKIKLLDM